MLIKAGEEECAVAADGAAQGEAELLLLVVRFEIHERMLGGQSAVAQVVEIGSVKRVGAGFSHHVHHRTTGASQVSAVGVGGNAEFLNYLVGKLVGRAVAPRAWPKKALLLSPPSTR